MSTIDFVILWVDNNDPTWNEEYSKYSLLEIGEKRQARFRDWENLHYWFRGVEKYAPWVNKVFLITANQTPDWIDVNHPKLILINHEDYIPKELLPTFSSSTIEMFIHKLPELSEKFVLFNDDFFIINKVTSDRFFLKGIPRDMSAMNSYNGAGLSANCMCNLEVLNRNFKQREVIKKNLFKWFNIQNGKHLVKTLLLVWWPYFVGFYEHHLPQPFLKSTFKEVWDKEGDTIYNSIRPRFRQKTNLTQYLFRYWQLAKGNFSCYNICADSVSFQHLKEEEVDRVIDTIINQNKNIIVINDSEEINFEETKYKINNAFQYILPNKSSFEK